MGLLFRPAEFGRFRVSLAARITGQSIVDVTSGVDGGDGDSAELNGCGI